MITNNYADEGLGSINFQRIRQLHPLVDYCESQGIGLRRTSNRWIGKCPLHDEQNGTAFVVHPNQKWQCYGKCARQGDVIDLERELHGGTITEAARRLDPTSGKIVSLHFATETSRPLGVLSQDTAAVGRPCIPGAGPAR